MFQGLSESEITAFLKLAFQLKNSEAFNLILFGKTELEVEKMLDNSKFTAVNMVITHTDELLGMRSGKRIMYRFLSKMFAQQ